MNAYQRVKKRTQACAQAITQFLERLEGSEAVRGVIFIALLAMIGLSMYLLNAHMPVILDDFDFAISWATGEKLASIADIVASQVVHYRTWGGRLVQFFSQLFMYWGDGVFNVLNTLMYLVLLLEIYAIARPERRFCWTLILLEHLALLNMLPFFGTVFLWMCGSCNYLFGTSLALIPLLVLRNVKDGGWLSRGGKRSVLCFLLGVLGGWTNENMTCGMIALVFAALAIEWLEGRGLKKRLAAMWAGQCTGALILLLAPGNFSRASAYTYDSMLVEMIRRFVMTTAYGVSYLGLLLGAALLLGAVLKENGARRGYAGVLVFGAIIGVYALVGSPELSDRAFTGMFALALSAVMVFVGDAEAHIRRLDAAKIAALPLVLVVLAYTSYHALSDVRAFESAWQLQTDAIECALAQGKTEAVVDSIESHSRFTMDVQFAEDAKTWPNTSISKIYGVDVIGR